MQSSLISLSRLLLDRISVAIIRIERSRLQPTSDHTMATDKAKTNAYPGEVEETYPDIFNIQAMPTQPLEKKPGQLPDHMIKQFFEEVALSLSLCYKC